MGKARDKVCECCARVVSGANWSRHLKTSSHLKQAKGKPIKVVAVKEAPPPKIGRAHV